MHRETVRDGQQAGGIVAISVAGDWGLLEVTAEEVDVAEREGMGGEERLAGKKCR